MTINANSSANGTRTANLPGSGAALTVCGWFRVKNWATSAQYNTLIQLGAVSVGDDEAYVLLDNATGTFQWAVSNGAYTQNNLGSLGQPTTTGVFVAIRRAATTGVLTFSIMAEGGSSLTNVTGVTGFTSALVKMEFLADQYGGQSEDIDALMMRLFDRELSDADLIANANSLTPVGANQNCSFPAAAPGNWGNDDSGNGRNLTLGGTAASATWIPSNLAGSSAATALAAAGVLTAAAEIRTNAAAAFAANATLTGAALRQINAAAAFGAGAALAPAGAAQANAAAAFAADATLVATSDGKTNATAALAAGAALAVTGGNYNMSAAAALTASATLTGAAQAPINAAAAFSAGATLSAAAEKRVNAVAAMIASGDLDASTVKHLVIICHGNSLTHSPIGDAYPGKLGDMLTAAGFPNTIHVEAVDNATTPTLRDLLPSLAAAYLGSDPTKRYILIMLEWLDDIQDDLNTAVVNNAAITAAAAMARYTDYVSVARTVGFTEILQGTVMDTTEYDFDPAFVNARLAANALLRQQPCPSGADAIVDFYAQPPLQNAANLAYWTPDGLHVNGAGSGIMADAAFGYLLAYLFPTDLDANFAVGATLAAAASGVISSTAAFSAGASLVAAPDGAVNAAAAFGASATLATTGRSINSSAVAFAAAGSLAAAGSGLLTAAAALAGGATLVVTSQTRINAVTALAAAAALAVTGRSINTSATALTANATLVGAGQGIANAAAALAAGASLVGNALLPGLAAAALTASGTLAVTGRSIANATATFAAGAQLASVASRRINASAAFTGGATLTVSLEPPVPPAPDDLLPLSGLALLSELYEQRIRQGELDVDIPRPWRYTVAALATRGCIYAGSFDLQTLTGFNTSGSIRYLQLFDQGKLPTNGQTPMAVFMLSASSAFEITPQSGLSFVRGAFYAFSSTPATLTLAAAELWLSAYGKTP